MKTVIKILIIFVLTMNVCFAQEQTMLMSGQFDNLEIKDVPVAKLYVVDKEFKALEVLGKPIKVDSIYKSAEPVWHFYYPEFVLTFIQLFPSGPELLEIEVLDEEANFTLDETNLFRSNQQSLRSSISRFELRTIDSKLSENEKFGREHQYIEYRLNGGVINKIIYRIDPNL